MIAIAGRLNKVAFIVQVLKVKKLNFANFWIDLILIITFLHGFHL